MNGVRKLACGVALCLLAGVASAASDGVKWTYSGTTLTEILTPEAEAAGAVPWRFTLSDGTLNLIAKETFGTGKVLDLRQATMPDGTPAITTIGNLRYCKTCEEVYLPETTTAGSASAFYDWTALKRVEFPPENNVTWGSQAFAGNTALTNAVLPRQQTVIGESMFQGCTALASVTFPDGLIEIKKQAFRNCSGLKEIRLPETVTTIGEAAFRECTQIASVEPFLSPTVTSLGSNAFQGCPITNAFSYGFSTNAVTQEAIPVTLMAGTLYGCNKVPSVRIGPGVSSVPSSFSSCSGLMSVEFGCNVTNIAGIVGVSKSTALTNVVFKATDTVVFSADRAFREEYNLKEITWNGWFEYTAVDATNPFRGWNALQCRFIVPGDNPQWLSYVSDLTKITPWASCSQSDKDTYFNRYGQDAKEPVGVSIAVANGLPRTYIVKTDAQVTGFPLTLTLSDGRFGSVSADPAPPASGFYAPGTQVTVTAVPASGSTFNGWIGSVSSAQEKVATIVVTMDEAKSLYASITRDSFLYENGNLTDGELQLAATRTIDGAVTNFTLTALVSAPKFHVYDLSKPVAPGGSVVAIGESLLDGKTDVWEIKLPLSLRSIGRSAFRCVNLVSVEPCLPDGVISYGDRIFHNCASLTNDLRVGYAVDEQGHSVWSTLNVKNDEIVFLTGCSNVRSVYIGPGIGVVPSTFFASEGARYVEFGRNVTNVAARVSSTVTNVVFLTTQTVSFTGEGRTFDGCNQLRDITWNGWFDYTPDADKNPFRNWPDLQCRFFVMKNNAEWQAFMGDSSRFTPWRQCSVADREAYYSRYGADAVRPSGITVAVPNGLPKTYVIGPKSGLVITVK